MNYEFWVNIFWSFDTVSPGHPAYAMNREHDHTHILHMYMSWYIGPHVWPRPDSYAQVLGKRVTVTFTLYTRLLPFVCWAHICAVRFIMYGAFSVLVADHSIYSIHRDTKISINCIDDDLTGLPGIKHPIGGVVLQMHFRFAVNNNNKWCSFAGAWCYDM